MDQLQLKIISIEAEDYADKSTLATTDAGSERHRCVQEKEMQRLHCNLV